MGRSLSGVARAGVTCAAVLCFAACAASDSDDRTEIGSHGSADEATQCKLTVGGIVRGLAGKGLVLHNGATAETVTASSDGAYTFPKPLCKGDAYAITIQQNPTDAWQTCVFVDPTYASGKIEDRSILDVNVTCRTNVYDLKVRVGGLTGTGLVFQNGLGDDLEVVANGTFTFPTKVASGAAYAVTRTDPILPWQTCTIASPNGKIANADVTVDVTCTTGNHLIGGKLIGLKGSGLVLTNNDGGDLTFGPANNGPFAFPTSLPSGASYEVEVKTQPTGVSGERCIVEAATGRVTGGKVETVTVRCSSPKKVFVSSAIYNGNLGGLTGADQKCQTLADAAGLGGTYMAWISTDAGSPFSRFTRSIAPYVLVDGTVIANDWDDLTDGTLAAPIMKTEKNGTPPDGTNACDKPSVWSGTSPDGTRRGSACNNFTSTSGTATWGHASQTEDGWWSVRCGGGSCSTVSAIYCFEQ